MADDIFRSISSEERAEHKVEGSRFIAESFQVDERDLAETIITGIRKREHKATHHCSAFRLGADGGTFYYDDDGEPGGTAGQPILRQIDGRELTNVLVVVTRYYGGTKLGTGGLARAYGDAASEVLDLSAIINHVVRKPVSLTFAYDHTAAVEQLLQQFDVRKREADYSDVTELHLAIRESQLERFLQAFTNKLGGQGEVAVPES